MSIILNAGADAIAKIPALLAQGMSILTSVMNDPAFQQMMKDVRDLVGTTGTISVSAGGGSPVTTGPTGPTGPTDTEIAAEAVATALESLADFIEQHADTLGDQFARDLKALQDDTAVVRANIEAAMNAIFNQAHVHTIQQLEALAEPNRRG